MFRLGGSGGENPGDLISEVRLVWSKMGDSKDLCLALVGTVNYREIFNTDDQLSIFTEYVKQQGGNANINN